MSSHRLGMPGRAGSGATTSATSIRHYTAVPQIRLLLADTYTTPNRHVRTSRSKNQSHLGYLRRSCQFRHSHEKRNLTPSEVRSAAHCLLGCTAPALNGETPLSVSTFLRPANYFADNPVTVAIWNRTFSLTTALPPATLTAAGFSAPSAVCVVCSNS